MYMIHILYIYIYMCMRHIYYVYILYILYIKYITYICVLYVCVLYIYYIYIYIVSLFFSLDFILYYVASNSLKIAPFLRNFAPSM